MSADDAVDLSSLTQAKQRSERIRILCMIGLFAVFVLLSVFRIVVPWNEKPSMGWIVLAMSAAYLAGEALMFRAVTWSLGNGQTPDRRLGALHGMAERLFAVGRT